jgi:zinc protease
MPLAPVRAVLPNGIVVLSKRTRTMPAVTVLAGVRAGAYYDPQGAEGTAALVARVLDRGTERRTASAIADELDTRGASLSVITGRHQLAVSATCLADDFDVILALIADMLRRPLFDERQVATRRAELATAVLQDEDDPGAVAVNTVMSRLYPDHPYGRRPRGSPATVAALTREHVERFHRAWFTPDGTTIVVVGDVDEQAATRRVQDEFGAWTTMRAPEARLAAIEGPRSRSLSVVPMMAKAQADIAYAFVGLRRADPDYYAAWVMNNAVGQYALGGRLGDSIRERQGMAYSVNSTLDASLAEGPVMIRAGVAAANVEQAIRSIDHELGAVRDEGLTPKEVDESKRYLIGSMPRQLETNAGIAAFLLSAELHGLGTDHDQRLPDLVASVTVADAHRLALRLLDPARATIVVAGPWRGPGGADAAVATDGAALVATRTSP